MSKRPGSVGVKRKLEVLDRDAFYERPRCKGLWLVCGRSKAARQKRCPQGSGDPSGSRIWFEATSSRRCTPPWWMPSSQTLSLWSKSQTPAALGKRCYPWTTMPSSGATRSSTPARWPMAVSTGQASISFAPMPWRLGIHLERLFTSAKAAKLKLPFGDSEEENRRKITATWRQIDA